MPKARAKRSGIWLHFTKCSESDETVTVKCEMCKVTVPYCGNTINLWSHIRIHHEDVLECMSHPPSESRADYAMDTIAGCSFLSNNNPAGSNPLPNDLTMQTVPNGYEEVETKRSDSKRADEITRSLVQMMADDVHPFSILNDRGFINFVKRLNEKYELPDMNYFTSTYIPELYVAKCKKIKENLSRAPSVHLTIDSWADKHRKIFLLRTIAHYFVDRTLHQNGLRISYFPEWQTTKALYESLSHTVESWNLTSKIKTVVTDGTVNVILAVFKTPWQQVLCFGHSLNKVVLKILESIDRILRKCRDTVHAFETSNIASKLLRRQQIREKLPRVLRLKRDIPAHWHSAYLMLNRMIDLRSSLTAVHKEFPLDNIPNITNDEWQTIIDVAKVLKPLHEATREMCSDRYAAISKVIPIVRCVEVALKNKKDLVPDVGFLRDNLLRELNKFFEHIESDTVYAIATFLDPRYKDIVFKSKECVDQTKRQLMNEYNRLNRERSSSDAQPIIKIQTDNDNVETNDSLWAAFDKKVQQIEADINCSSTTMEHELNRYLQSIVINRKSNPITWWNTEGSTLFPNLMKLALEYLCIPATSVPSEHLFSKAGEILSSRMQRLQPEDLDMYAVLSSDRHE